MMATWKCDAREYESRKAASCGGRRIPAAAAAAVAAVQVGRRMNGREASDGVDQAVTTELCGHARHTRARKTREEGRRSARGGILLLFFAQSVGADGHLGNKEVLRSLERPRSWAQPTATSVPRLLGHGEKTDHRQTFRRRRLPPPPPPPLYRQARQTTVSHLVASPPPPPPPPLHLPAHLQNNRVFVESTVSLKTRRPTLPVYPIGLK
uniref:Uncharacterized protein n=1 Tax=Plectus sambesii TaxID=2011161 RepID=A0A914VKP4_9BILA